MAEGELPELRQFVIPEDLELPVKKIYSDDDVQLWKTTQGYRDFGLFIRRLNESVVGHYSPFEGPKSEAVHKTVAMLDEIDKWTEEIPPKEGPQRFGNLAFREWGDKLTKTAPQLLKNLLPESIHAAIPALTPYLLHSFGNFTRMDYGTGHELSFAMLLCVLSLLRFYVPHPEDERTLVLVVYHRYLNLVWKLQDTYRLEPAGSRGVHGLDDYQFLSYLWGSAQLREHLTARPKDMLNPPLDNLNLFYQSVNRVLKLKTGPFAEHSATLAGIAEYVPTWWKVNHSLMKMYEGEVLDKRVAIQHIPFGGILEWDIAETESEGEDEMKNYRSPTVEVLPRRASMAHDPSTTSRTAWAAANGVGEPPSEAFFPTNADVTAPAKPTTPTSPATPIQPLRQPTRQGTMPRPKGGRLTGTSGTSPNIADKPLSEEPEEEESLSGGVEKVTETEPAESSGATKNPFPPLASLTLLDSSGPVCDSTPDPSGTGGTGACAATTQEITLPASEAAPSVVTPSTAVNSSKPNPPEGEAQKHKDKPTNGIKPENTAATKAPEATQQVTNDKTTKEGLSIIAKLVHWFNRSRLIRRRKRKEGQPVTSST